MPSLTEHLFAGIVRACAVLVAAVPIVAAAALLWTGVATAVAERAFPGGADLAATAAFTLAVCACAAIGGGAFGIGCAVAAEELTPASIHRAIEAAIGFFGVLPAVAFGWFAASFIAPLASHRPLGDATPFFAATILLAVMIAPTACTLMTRSLRRVPDATRQAAAAAGASRLQTTALVIIPALRRRIIATVLAAFTRAVGEATAVQVLFASLASFGVLSPLTTASWLFSTAAHAPAAASAGQLSFAALALLAVSVAGGSIVARAYRGMQWA